MLALEISSVHCTTKVSTLLADSPALLCKVRMLSGVAGRYFFFFLVGLTLFLLYVIVIQSDILLAFFVIGEWALCLYRANGGMLVYRNAVLSLARFCGLNKCGIAMPAWEVTCLWLKSFLLLYWEADLSPFHISTPPIPFQVFAIFQFCWSLFYLLIGELWQ